MIDPVSEERRRVISEIHEFVLENTGGERRISFRVEGNRYKRKCDSYLTDIYHKTMPLYGPGVNRNFVVFERSTDGTNGWVNRANYRRLSCQDENNIHVGLSRILDEKTLMEIRKAKILKTLAKKHRT